MNILYSDQYQIVYLSQEDLNMIYFMPHQSAPYQLAFTMFKRTSFDKRWSNYPS